MNDALTRRDVQRLEGKTGAAVWMVLGATAMAIGMIPVYRFSDAVAHAVVTDTTAPYPLGSLAVGMVLFMLGTIVSTLGGSFWRYA